MTADSPEEICALFQRYMRSGDIDAALTVYDPEVVFLSQDRKLRRGVEELRQELAPLAASKAIFEFTILEIIQTRDTALMHTQWDIRSPPSTESQTVYAMEVARRQRDGSWRWLIGDPFTVGKHATLHARPT